MSVGKRISIVLSTLWGLAIIAAANSNYTFNWDMMLFGIVVLVVLWGIYWITLGAKHKTVNEVHAPGVINEESSTFPDSDYEAKLKRFGLEIKDNISLSSIILLILISLAVGMSQALTGTTGKYFDLAGAIGGAFKILCQLKFLNIKYAV